MPIQFRMENYGECFKASTISQPEYENGHVKSTISKCMNDLHSYWVDEFIFFSKTHVKFT